MPLTLLIDADQYELVFIRVDSINDVLRRLQRYFVLGRSTAKEDSDTNFLAMVLSVYDFEAVDSDRNLQISARAADNRHCGRFRF